LAALHPQLEADCLVLGRLELCHVLLMRDANYPWCILVPDREDITEIHHLNEADQLQLMRESVRLSHALESVFSPDKLNIASLGNVVPQCHVHHVVRYHSDVAWPGPVWGRVPAREYSAEALAEVTAAIKQALSL
jgi:diadenosine tetraphosphate (Ap4A) HIT family hydrolase